MPHLFKEDPPSSLFMLVLPSPYFFCFLSPSSLSFLAVSPSSLNRSSPLLKSKKICIHLHVLFCSLKLSSPDFAKAVPFPPSASSSEVAITAQSSSSTSTSVGRMSTLQMNLKRSIPYPVPQEYFRAHGEHGNNWPDHFVPESIQCELCGSALTSAQRHPGQGHNDRSYIVTPCSFQTVDVKVKICTNRNCKAMHQVWPVEQGTVTY